MTSGPDILKKSPEEIKAMAAQPLQVGMKVHADSVISLGKEADTPKHEARIKAVASMVGGVALKVAAVMGVKALFALAAFAAFPVAAPLIVAAVFVSWSSVEVIKNAAEFTHKVGESKQRYQAQGMGTSKSLLKALNDNKLRGVMQLGASAAMVLEATGGLGISVDALTDSVVEVGNRLKDKQDVSKSKFAAGFVQGAPAPAAPAPVIEAPKQEEPVKTVVKKAPARPKGPGGMG